MFPSDCWKWFLTIWANIQYLIGLICQRSLGYPSNLGGIKKCTCMVILNNFEWFALNSALFGLVKGVTPSMCISQSLAGPQIHSFPLWQQPFLSCSILHLQFVWGGTTLETCPNSHSCFPSIPRNSKGRNGSHIMGPPKAQVYLAPLLSGWFAFRAPGQE